MVPDVRTDRLPGALAKLSEIGGYDDFMMKIRRARP